MDSLKEVKQTENQVLEEPTKCVWILTKGAKIGQKCGRITIGHQYCKMHKECNPDLQGAYSSVYTASECSEDENEELTTKKFKNLVIDENNIIEFVIKRKHVRIIIE